MEYAQDSLSENTFGHKDQIIKLVDTFLDKALHSIPLEWRDILNPKKSSWTMAEFISCYEKACPGGKLRDNFILPEVMKKFSEIYGQLKNYIRVLSCSDRSAENFKERCEFLSHLGFDRRMLLKYYDAVNNRYKLFEALQYFVFKALPLNETDEFILRHHLNYSNEYALSNGEDLPGKPNVTSRHLEKQTPLVEMEVEKYISNFKVLLPWFDYQGIFTHAKEYIKLTPLNLLEIRGKENAKYLTMPLLVEIICSMNDYKIFLIATDKTDSYILVRKEISEECGISSNKKKITFNLVNINKVNEDNSRVILKRMLVLLYRLLPELAFCAFL